MIIKKYIVNDMKEAVVRAKYELGREAVIISQRTVKTGKWYHPFRKRKLEVTVALEESMREMPIYSLWDAIENDPMFKDANEKLKEQLVNYCKLHSIENYNLSVEQKTDFMRIVCKDNCFEKKFNLGRINILIGPTGVGKTTTIAKIAAKEHLVNKKKVGLITMDTYRIGAVEQLKTYANILGIPFEVVNEPSEMEEKINKLNHCDILLIDTLGTSPNNKGKLDDIGQYMANISGKIHRYLVMSISTDRDTALSTMKKYEGLKYDALILTKFDEVDNFVNLWSIIENNNYPVEYFCYGQDVPDDIQKATLGNLIAYCEGIRQYD